MWLLLSPTRLEAPFLRGEPFTFLVWKGLKGEGFVYLETGVGKVNAAMALTAYALRHPVEKALLFGIAGAYPGSRLALGQAVLVGEEVEADLEPLPFPSLELGGRRFYRHFPLDRELTASLAEALGLEVARGLTRDLVSGTPEEAQALARGFGAQVESMEGAAFARACLALGLRGVELRAVSNAAGVRDRGAWRLKEAVTALEAAVARILE